MDGISGEEGDFEVTIRQAPRYVDMDKCIACGVCADKCPKKAPDEYDGNLTKRKAISVRYAQAVPLKYAIDPENCIYLIKGKCKACEKFCPTGAIKFDDQEKVLKLNVGAVVLTTGSQTYDPGVHDTYGYKTSPNIVTSLEFERILSASGPYGGHLVRPSDKQEPQKIAWLQCIGSRDVHLGAKGYCSGVCCTYAIKEAMLAMDHQQGLDTAIFYIDIRTFGKDFERYYNRSKDQGVRFIKSKITNIDPLNDDGRHIIRYVDAGGQRLEEAFDIVVLSVGLSAPPEIQQTAEKLGVGLDKYGFAATPGFQPVQSTKPGVYVCGALQAPKDIPSSVIDASAVAGVVGGKLAQQRWTLTQTREIPEEIDIRGEPPRIGAFICSCGSNIAGFVDVDEVVEFAKTLPYVAYANKNMFSCSQDTQDAMTQIIKEKRLNRVVVAACTPKTHEPLFQETLINAGLNKYLFEMANIRNQCSWVHKNDKDKATAKAKDLVRMAVAKVALHDPLAEPKLEVNQNALVIGGGVAGMNAALNLSTQGYKTFLLEKSDALGGQARYLHETWRRENIGRYLDRLIEKVNADANIETLLESEIEQVDGFVGNFKTTVKCGEDARELDHGVTIVATGANEYKPDQYLYGQDSRVVTGLEMHQRLAQNSSLTNIKTVVFIQCVGSRIPERPYCSKVCCTQSIKQALTLKELNADTNVFILYRDMRPYGLREDLYREARAKGITFIRYDDAHPLDVAADQDDLKVGFRDLVVRRKMEIRPNLLVLASAMVPPKDKHLSTLYKLSQNDDGFYAEAHVKLRPNDFATDGVFLCGLAHGPKPIDESIAQAQAASARAVTVLSALTISVSGTVAQVNPMDCSSCGVCVSICPYSAPRFDEKTGKATIESALCKGCGLCVASCRSGALHLKGFDNSQILEMVSGSLFN